MPATDMRRPFLLPLFAAAFLALLTACVAGTRLDTGGALPAEASGRYRLYLYGCLHPQDLENMALLVDETSALAFELFASPTSYRVEHGLTGPEALSRAEAFIHCNIADTGRNLLRRISDPAGRTIAFEVKPLFSPLEMGRSEVLDSTYYLDNGRIRIYLTLDPWVERAQRRGQWGTGGT